MDRLAQQAYGLALTLHGSGCHVLRVWWRALCLLKGQDGATADTTAARAPTTRGPLSSQSRMS